MGRRIQFRRGPEATRLQTVLGNGEPGFSTDIKQLYVGDGETLGGVPVLMSKFIEVAAPSVAACGARHLFQAVTTLQLPDEAQNGTTLSVMLSPHAGATQELPARVLAPVSKTISDDEGNADTEYHMTISGIERTFIFIDGGWQIWR